MASGTEATDDWCENQCAAYGCEEDAQKVCKCSARHTAQQPEAAEGPADGDEVTIHHEVKGEEAADADEQAMASWAGAPLSSDEQAEQSRKQAEKDARAVEAANEAQRKAVEAEAKKIAAAGEVSQMDANPNPNPNPNANPNPNPNPYPNPNPNATITNRRMSRAWACTTSPHPQ